MEKNLHAGIIVSYPKDRPTSVYYVSFVDATAKTASITSIKTPLVIHHDVPWADLEILNDSEGDDP